MRASYDGLDDVWNARADALNDRLAARRPSGPRGQSRVDLDDVLHARRRATTGCSSTTCVPRAWPSAGSEAAGLIFSHNYTDADFAAVDRSVRRGGPGDARRWLVVAHAGR